VAFLLDTNLLVRLTNGNDVLHSTAGIIGKQVYDARLVAVCHVHGVTHLLTFNTADFARVSAFGPGLAVVHPATV
jgi:predicted nucleic acid-binding protein